MKNYSNDIPTKEQHDELAKHNEEQIDQLKLHIHGLNESHTYVEERLAETMAELVKVKKAQCWHIVGTLCLTGAVAVLSITIF